MYVIRVRWLCNHWNDGSVLNGRVALKFRTGGSNSPGVFKNSEYFQIYLNAHLQFGELFVLEAVYPSKTPMERYRISAKEGAFLRVLTVWFNGGMQESPEEMGKICEELIYNALDTSFFVDRPIIEIRSNKDKNE